MENAASALQMAAGVLLALLLISLFVYVFNSISQTENTRADVEAAAEITKFNNKFLAFDKSSMYGTDLISILGLAISNNQIYNQVNEYHPDGRYRENIEGTINIKFKLKEDVYTRKTYYKFTSTYNNGEWENKWNLDSDKTPNPEKTVVLNRNIMYTLETTVGYDAIQKIAIEGNQNVSQKVNGKKMIEEDNSGFDDLKKRIFKCTNVEYNGVGRIYCMTFEEKDID